jgi:tetratricopeptide (TPR) repeat protein
MEAVRENDLLARQSVLRGHARGNIPFSRIWGVLALAELGEFAEAIAQGEDALRISGQEFGRHSDVWAHLGVGRLYLVKGDVTRAIEVLERGLPLCEAASDLAVYFSRTAASLGGAYALSGRLDEGLRLLERADRHAQSIGFAYGHALVVVTLAEARLLAGDIENAAGAAAQALTLSRRHGQRGWEAWTLRLLADLAARRSEIEATGPYEEALALATELGMRPLAAHCQLGRGVLESRTGSPERAREYLNAAVSEYRRMQMPFWLEQAESAMNALHGSR